MDRIARWLIGLLQRFVKPDPVVDLRQFGPFIECPRCQCSVMSTEIALDPDTMLPGFWVLDVTCVNCGAVYKSACPADFMVMEWAADSEEY